MKVEKKHKEMKEVEILDSRKYYCDRCGNELEELKMGEMKSYKISFKIRFIKGHSYDDGYNGEGVEAHLCDTCREHVQDLLIADGVKFERIDFCY